MKLPTNTLCWSLTVSAMLLLTPAITGSAQTATTYINQGRAFLAARDLTNANASFASAVRVSASHATGNVFYAATRLLTLGNQPAGKALLDRLGFSSDGRYEYKWTSQPPQDTNGVPFTPPGVSAAELSMFLRTNVLKEISAAASNLAKVTSTTFKLNLTSNETTTTALTIDYGDVLLVRAILEAAKYFGYTVHSWDVDAQLSAFRALFASEDQTIESFLGAHPNLFAFDSTNDLAAARLSFTNAIRLYFAASDFIWKRPAGAVRLFTFEPDSQKDETRFRTVLTNLNKAVSAATAFPFNTNLVFDLRHHFDGKGSPRSFLPEFAGNRIVCGRWPDLSLHGLLAGLNYPDLEGAIVSFAADFNAANPFTFRITSSISSNSNQVTLQFAGLDNHVYVLQVSTDTVNWTDLNWGIPEAGWLAFNLVIPPPTLVNSAYCRVVDITASEPLVGRIYDVLTGQPIRAQLSVLRQGEYEREFSTDDSGRFAFVAPSQPWAYQLEAQAGGYESTLVGMGDAGHERQIYLAPVGIHPGNDDFADRTILSGTNVAVTGYNAGATTDALEPGSQCVWWSWTAPKGGVVTVDASGSSFDTVVQVFTGSGLSSLVPWAWDDDSGTGNASKLDFYVSAGTTYSIAVYGYGNSFGRIVLDLNYTTPRAPVFTHQPESSAVYSGETMEIYAEVTGTQPLTFQWRKNGVALTGQTDSYLELDGVQTSASGTYTLVAKNSTATVTSSPATITVSTSAPKITEHPEGRQVMVGSYVTFWVEAEGSQPMTYQWRKNGVILPGETENYLWLGPVTSGDEGSYSVLVKNAYGSATSSSAVLTVY